MSHMNSVILQGNLVRDVELRYTPKGIAVAEFTVANNRKFGEREDVAFISCTAWDKSAENMSQYFKKGDPILVRGRLATETWDDKTTHAKRSKTKLIVEEWSFCGGKKQGQSDAKPEREKPDASDIPPRPGAPEQPSQPEDDVPF